MADANERLEALRREVAGLPVPAASEDQRWRVAAFALLGIGLLTIGVGWWGASGTKDVSVQIPYLISGGLLGLALVIIGASLLAVQSLRSFLRFWLLRLLAEQQRDD